MAPCYEKIILCRGLSEKNDSQEAYVKTLKTAGYSCDCLPTLRFEFVNISEFRACLLSSYSYYGLILTSQRAAEAIKLSAKEDDNILHPWRILPVYCVGPATESFAKTYLSSDNCFGKEAGNAKELAELLVASVAEKSKPLLYPCSEIGRETIEKTLNENDIKVHKIVVYRTLPSETLEHDLLKFMDNMPKIFVFFSPSIVEHIVALLKKKLYDMNNIKAVAIGPVTEQALVHAGLKVFATANKPDPISLLKAISDAEKSGLDEKTE
ncbi:uroporphyrinogen-III synthase [Bombus pyrosoma]|uniref:uroporphyrinogen-III synthase n=1 Tax=Bombus pyrosoma TaxID=396416 RepID=UPI001CB8A858|nr:uroporphyrinogen-III synthase [Bombus pyrosoma]